MTYFSNIQSLSGLKKQYRTLALANHPDRGGSTETMQKINAEFEKLYKIWEHITTTEADTGYDNDYTGASAKQYTQHVWNEYRWTGSRYKGQRPSEIVETVRKWLKESYPGYKFSITRRNYNSITVNLMIADFNPFVEGVTKAYKQVNHYWFDSDKELTDRARDVMRNVIGYVQSYNYDDSDAMTDYFNTNFYLHIGIGSYEKPYKMEIPKSRRTGGKPAEPRFSHPEGAAHKAIRQALSGSLFQTWDSRKHGEINVLGRRTFGEDGKEYFWPNDYSSRKQAEGRLQKLAAAGIRCKLTGCNGGYIQLLGYAAETEAALERERSEVAEAMKLWREKHAA